MEIMFKFIKSLILIILFINVSCTSLMKKNSLDITTTTELIKEISIKKEKFSLVMEYDSLIVFFPKSSVIEHIDMYLDTFTLKIDSGKNISFNTRMYKKYFSMKSFLIDKEYYKIIDISEIDSLNGINVIERMRYMDENVEIGFTLYFNDIFCMLLDKGDLSIIENERFINKIDKVQYYRGSKYNGYSSIKYFTKSGKEICNCPPIYHYD